VTAVSRVEQTGPAAPWCYLCGSELGSRPSNWDHVPPKRFFPRSLRTGLRLHLLRLRTHVGCNNSYQLDEEYFCAALLPLSIASSSLTAQDAFEDLVRGAQQPQGARLLMTVGYLPETIDVPDEGNATVLRNAILDAASHDEPCAVLRGLDQPRLHRVIWKIVRGLVICCMDYYLPECTSHTIEISMSLESPREKGSGWLSYHGDDEGVFCFRYAIAAKGRNLWELVIWSRIVASVSFVSS